MDASWQSKGNSMAFNKIQHAELQAILVLGHGNLGWVAMGTMQGRPPFWARVVPQLAEWNGQPWALSTIEGPMCVQREVNGPWT